jgi:hypothetical protein
MNDWNWLENQLRGWIPRGPSAKLERRLFFHARGSVGGPRRSRRVATPNWLAPATAFSLLLTLFAAERCFRATDSLAAATNPRLITAALSNQSYAAYVGSANVGFNAPILGLPKQGGLTASSSPSLATNHSLY